MAFTEAICPSINLALERAFELRQIKRRNTGFLDMIMSQRNRAGVEEVPYDNRNGTYKDSVKLTFLPTIDPAEFGDTIGSICDDGTPYNPAEMDVKVTKEYGLLAPKTIALSDLEMLCDPNPTEYKAQFTMEILNGLAWGLDARLVALQDAKWGDFYNSGNAALSYPLLKADFSANQGGMNQVLSHYIDLGGGNDRPMLVGAGNLQLYALNLNIGCCNAEGQDLNQAAGLFDWFPDLNAETGWGINEFGLFFPGVVQLVTFNKYRGIGGIKAGNDGFYEQGIISDPFRGLNYDFKIDYNKCFDTWSYTIGLRYELIWLPTNLFNVNDERNGANGTLNFVATQL